MNTNMPANLPLLLLTAAIVAGASAYLGSFMILKRMALVGDALSHVALPGIAIAILLGINPMLGALIALIAAVFGVWYLSEKSEIYTESLIGIFFTGSLSLGLLITPKTDLLEALFGDIQKVTSLDALIVLFLSFAVFVITYFFSKKIMLGIVSEDLAKSIGIKTKLVNLVYLLMVGLVVALGVKFVGTLLTGALVIIPAVSAKNISRGIGSYQLASTIFGSLSALIGIVIASLLNLSVGPVVVLISIFFFAFSLLFSRK